MTDETNPGIPAEDIAEGAVEQPGAAGSAVHEPAVAAPPVPPKSARRTGTWVAAVAVAAVLAVVLSAASFGAGVFVGRQTGRFDRDFAQAPGISANAQLTGAPMGGQMPQGMGGMRGGDGLDGRGGRGGRGFDRGFPGSPDASATTR